jgi:hypothetical protein
MIAFCRGAGWRRAPARDGRGSGPGGPSRAQFLRSAVSWRSNRPSPRRCARAIPPTWGPTSSRSNGRTAATSLVTTTLSSAERPPTLCGSIAARAPLLDLKAPEGKDALVRLLKPADVFLSNLSPGAVDRIVSDQRADKGSTSVW